MNYHLTADQRHIYALPGSDEQRRLLLSIPGAEAISNGWVTVPRTRENFLSVEVVGPVTSTTDDYLDQRLRFLYPGGLRVEEMRRRVLDLGVDYPALLPHQKHALTQFYDKPAAYLAADQGTGKTRVALILAHLWQARRVLVVCPKSISRQWDEEHQRVWGHTDRHVLFEHLTQGPSLEARARVLRDLVDVGEFDYPLYVTVNYEAVSPLRLALLDYFPDVLILDEAWRVKNRKVAVTKSLLALTRAWRDAGTLRGVVALAGTPWGNDVGDIWSQLRIVAPEVVPEKYDDFLQSYSRFEVHRVARGRSVVKPVGLRNPVGLIRRLDPVWFRASKEVCLDLPPKTRRRVELNLPQQTWTLYRAVQRDGLAALGDELALDGAREVAVRLHQIAGGHRPVMHPSGAWALEPIVCPKVNWLREFAEDVLESDPTARCLVWCQYIVEVERVTKELQDILGHDRVFWCWSASPEERLAWAKESYQSRDPDGVQVLVCQWQKMAAGHDLPATTHSIVFSPTWSHILHDQAEDRGHRIGNTTGVQVIELCAKKTIDEAVYSALARKESFTGQLLIDTVVGEKTRK